MTFVQSYAHSHGFAVKIRNSVMTNGVPTYVYITCCCEGNWRHRDVVLRCRGNMKLACKWMVSAHQIDGSWIIYSFRDDHAHDLLSSDEMLHHPSAAFVPAMVEDEITRLVRIRDVSIMAIYEHTMTFAENHGMKQTWDYNKVRNLVAKHRKTATTHMFYEELLETSKTHSGFMWTMLVSDPSGVFQTLSSENETTSMSVSADVTLVRVFWGMQYDTVSLPLNPRRLLDVMFFDYTYQTNRYGFKLGVFSFMDPNNKTIPLEFALTCRERCEEVEWCMKEMR